MATMGWRVRGSALVGALLLASCSGAAQRSSVPDGERFEYISPVRAWDTKASGPEPTAPDANRDGTVTGHELLAYYPHQALRISALRVSGWGDPKVVVTESELNARYLLTIDQLNYRSDAHEDIAGAAQRVEWGVGVRLRASVKAFRAGIDFTNLAEIANAAELGLLTGSLRVETVGIRGPAIDDLLPSARPISLDSLRDAMQVAACIKALVDAGDAGVELAAEALLDAPRGPSPEATSRR